MNSVVHFEMPYGDPERMAKFYHSAFGWETKHLGEGMGDYMLATTTETDPQGSPRKPGAINGGFFPKQADRPAQGPSIVIAVDDIDDAIHRVNGAGGHVLGEPMEIPGVGRYVSFTDPEGNQVSMLQPMPGQASDTREEDNRSTRGSRLAGIGTQESRQQEWSPKRSSPHSSAPPVEQPQKSRGATTGSKSKTSRHRNG